MLKILRKKMRALKIFCEILLKNLSRQKILAKSVKIRGRVVKNWVEKNCKTGKKLQKGGWVPKVVEKICKSPNLGGGWVPKPILQFFSA